MDAFRRQPLEGCQVFLLPGEEKVSELMVTCNDSNIRNKLLVPEIDSPSFNHHSERVTINSMSARFPLFRVHVSKGSPPQPRFIILDASCVM